VSVQRILFKSFTKKNWVNTETIFEFWEINFFQQEYACSHFGSTHKSSVAIALVDANVSLLISPRPWEGSHGANEWRWRSAAVEQRATHVFCYAKLQTSTHTLFHSIHPSSGRRERESQGARDERVTRSPSPTQVFPPLVRCLSVWS